jgi:hypothetical protein
MTLYKDNDTRHARWHAYTGIESKLRCAQSYSDIKSVAIEYLRLEGKPHRKNIAPIEICRILLKECLMIHKMLIIYDKERAEAQRSTETSPE